MTSSGLALDPFLSTRSIRQYRQHWVSRLLYPACRGDVVQELRRRAQLGGEVITTCRLDGLQNIVQLKIILSDIQMWSSLYRLSGQSQDSDRLPLHCLQVQYSSVI